MIWDEFLRHFRFCDEEDSGLSDEEQERKGPKNRPKHARKRIHQAKKNFLEKFKTASQKESRFVLYIMPINPLLESLNPNLSTIVIQCLLQNKSLSFSYYDMHIKDEAVNSMEITLSPSITNAQRVIVEALRDKYAPQAKILNSSLGKVVRLK